jgi:tRNA uridine 5-carbamoylmethylation protein Kti12
MSDQPEVVLLVGNIGSGKSTLTKEYTKQGYLVISRDAFRYMLGAGDYTFDYDLEPCLRKTEIYMLKSLLYTGRNIVVDETNMNRKAREPLLCAALETPSHTTYRLTAVVFPRLSKEESVGRRLKNPHGSSSEELWGQVWEMFDSMYEEPTLGEGFDKVLKAKVEVVI